MNTVIAPNKCICSLWSCPKTSDYQSLRLMKYLIRVDYDNKVLLHNVVTGQLIALDSNEWTMLDRVPIKYAAELEELVQDHFLVPIQYDEHQQVVNLRKVLQLLEDSHKKSSITSYTILPTTACNARCYYCFEQGIKNVTMSEQTVKDLVDFISTHCGDDRKVFLTWFGGEPTVAEKRIDEICTGLSNKGIQYRSKMITNGYLFDDHMVKKAKKLWNLEALQICVDGTENSYNKIKNYVSSLISPYQRVMNNIGLLINNGISVGLRMNFDIGNYQEFYDLVNEIDKRFGHTKMLRLSAHPVIGEYADNEGEILHGSDKWFTEKLVELNDLARDRGLQSIPNRLPKLNHEACGAFSDSFVTITPDGGIAKCPEQFGEHDIIGNIRIGIDNAALARSWKNIADYEMCRECVLFPNCVRLENCTNKTYCHKKLDYLIQCESTIIKQYNLSK